MELKKYETKRLMIHFAPMKLKQYIIKCPFTINDIENKKERYLLIKGEGMDG